MDFADILLAKNYKPHPVKLFFASVVCFVVVGIPALFVAAFSVFSVYLLWFWEKGILDGICKHL
jgi:hypothetical protein